MVLAEVQTLMSRPLHSFYDASSTAHKLTGHLFFVCVSIGAQKLARIRENSNFFRSELQKMGFEVLGDNDSPVMPIMLYNPAKIPAFSRECLRQNVS